MNDERPHDEQVLKPAYAVILGLVAFIGVILYVRAPELPPPISYDDYRKAVGLNTEELVSTEAGLSVDEYRFVPSPADPTGVSVYVSGAVLDTCTDVGVRSFEIAPGAISLVLATTSRTVAGGGVCSTARTPFNLSFSTTSPVLAGGGAFMVVIQDSIKGMYQHKPATTTPAAPLTGQSGATSTTSVASTTSATSSEAIPTLTPVPVVPAGTSSPL